MNMNVKIEYVPEYNKDCENGIFYRKMIKINFLIDFTTAVLLTTMFFIIILLLILILNKIGVI